HFIGEVIRSGGDAEIPVDAVGDIRGALTNEEAPLVDEAVEAGVGEVGGVIIAGGAGDEARRAAGGPSVVEGAGVIIPVDEVPLEGAVIRADLGDGAGLAGGEGGEEVCGGGSGGT